MFNGKYRGTWFLKDETPIIEVIDPEIGQPYYFYVTKRYKRRTKVMVDFKDNVIVKITRCKPLKITQEEFKKLLEDMKEFII